MTFKDREEAGLLLAKALKEEILKRQNPIILAIPRGGVPVAFVISMELRVPMSIVIVRKLGLPWNEEAGFGAIDPDGSTYLDKDIVNSAKLDSEQIRELAEKELMEIRRREGIFMPSGYPDFKERSVFIVDDGIATGYTAIAGAGFSKRRGASEVIVAVPVCPRDSEPKFREVAEGFICLHEASEFSFAVGMFYRDFHQLTDEEVLSYIKRAREEGLFEP